MPRLRRFLRRLAILCLFGFVAYGVAGALIAQLPGVEVPADMPWIWPDFLPAWPFVAVLVVGGLAVAADIVVWVVLEARARSERERLEKLAEQWPRRADAKAAAAGGTRRCAWDASARRGCLRPSAWTGRRRRAASTAS